MKLLTEEDEDEELSSEFSDYSSEFSDYYIELDESEQITQDDFEEDEDS